MSPSLIDTDACCLCVRRGYDARPVFHVNVRWITIPFKDPCALQYERWHAGCGFCDFSPWREMKELGTLDLVDLLPGYQHNYHTEWNTRINNMAKENLVKHKCIEHADVDEMVEVKRKRRLWRSEIEMIQWKRQTSVSSWFLIPE